MRKKVVRIRFVARAGLSAAERLASELDSSELPRPRSGIAAPPVGFMKVILRGLRLPVDLKVARNIQ
jgi:hypothetical protein